MTQLSSKKVITSIINARHLIKDGREADWEQHLLKSHLQLPGNEDIVVLITDEFINYGAFEKAINFLQLYLGNGKATPRILNLMVFLSIQLEIYETAEKLLVQLTALEPQEPTHYLNLSDCLKKRGLQKDSFLFLLQVIPNFTGYAKLWSALAIGLEHYCAETSPIPPEIHSHILQVLDENNVNTPVRDLINAAHLKAITLDEQDSIALSNYANFLGERPAAKACYEQALKLDPDNPEFHVNYAIHLLATGDLNNGWSHYEYRQQLKGAGKGFTLSMPFSQWTGDTDKEASILVCGEQGLGDEILFLLNARHLISKFKKVYIGCDPRLVNILRHSFPECEVAAYSDKLSYNERIRTVPAFKNKKIDYQTLSGSIPSFLWHNLSSIPNVTGGYIKAPPVKLPLATVTELMARYPRVIGISWRSSNMSAGRAAGYWGLNSVKSLINHTEALFINLQYSATYEELDELSRYENFITFPELDLKNDLEANLAIMDICDHVIGPANATQMLSLALGANTWTISSGAPWYTFGNNKSDILPYAKHNHIFLTEPDQGWDRLIPVIHNKIISTAPSTTPKMERQEYLYAFFRTGVISDDIFQDAIKLRFPEPAFVFLTTDAERRAKEQGRSYWPNLPMAEQQKARFLKGGQVSDKLLKSLKTSLPYRKITFLLEIETAVKSLYNHKKTTLQNVTDDLSEFIIQEKKSLSYAFRFLNDFLGFSEKESARIFDKKHQDVMIRLLIEELDKFYFIGFQEEYDTSIREFLKAIDQPLSLNNIKNGIPEVNLSPKEFQLIRDTFFVDNTIYRHFKNKCKSL